MGNILIYVIIALGIYTVTISVGYYKSVIRHRHKNIYMMALRSVVNELKHIVTKEENVLMLEAKKNELTLTDLITTKPTEENYEEILELLVKLAKDTYEDYKFFIARSHDETKQSNFLQIVSNYHECPELHNAIFRQAIDYGINMQVLQKKFADKVAEGKVIDLGEDVVVITNDGTPQLPTGVSPINSGLEGGEIAFIISFIKKENFEEWTKNNLPQEKADEK